MWARSRRFVSFVFTPSLGIMDIATARLDLAKGTGGRSGVPVNLNLSYGKEEVRRACRMVVV